MPELFRMTGVLNVVSSNATKALREIDVQARQTARALDTASESARTITETVTGLAVLSAMARGFSSAAMKAAEFQGAMHNLNTIMRMSQADLKSYGDAVRVMGAEMGVAVGAAEAARAAYDIASSGFSDAASNALVLSSAMKAASAGMSDTKTAAAGIVGVLNAYSMGAGNAQHISDVMFKTVEDGVVTFDELAKYVGTAAPVAAQAGISFEELAAAIASSTRAMGNPSKVLVGLRGLLMKLISPSKQAQETYRSLGIEINEYTLRNEGLVGTLQKIYKASGGSVQTMRAVIEDARALSTALTLVRNDGKEVVKFLENYSNAAYVNGATQRALVEQQMSTSYQMKLLTTRFEVLVTMLGDKFLNVADPFIRVLNTTLDIVNGLGPAFQNWAAAILMVVAASKAAGPVRALSQGFRGKFYSGQGEAPDPTGRGGSAITRRMTPEEREAKKKAEEQAKADRKAQREADQDARRQKRQAEQDARRQKWAQQQDQWRAQRIADQQAKEQRKADLRAEAEAKKQVSELAAKQPAAQKAVEQAKRGVSIADAKGEAQRKQAQAVLNAADKDLAEKQKLAGELQLKATQDHVAAISKAGKDYSAKLKEISATYSGAVQTIKEKAKEALVGPRDTYKRAVAEAKATYTAAEDKARLQLESRLKRASRARTPELRATGFQIAREKYEDSLATARAAQTAAVGRAGRDFQAAVGREITRQQKAMDQAVQTRDKAVASARAEVKTTLGKINAQAAETSKAAQAAAAAVTEAEKKQAEASNALGVASQKAAAQTDAAKQELVKAQDALKNLELASNQAAAQLAKTKTPATGGAGASGFVGPTLPAAQLQLEKVAAQGEKIAAARLAAAQREADARVQQAKKNYEAADARASSHAKALLWAPDTAKMQKDLQQRKADLDAMQTRVKEAERAALSTRDAAVAAAQQRFNQTMANLTKKAGGDLSKVWDQPTLNLLAKRANEEFKRASEQAQQDLRTTLSPIHRQLETQRRDYSRALGDLTTATQTRTKLENETAPIQRQWVQSFRQLSEAQRQRAQINPLSRLSAVNQNVKDAESAVTAATQRREQALTTQAAIVATPAGPGPKVTDSEITALTQKRDFFVQSMAQIAKTGAETVRRIEFQTRQALDKVDKDFKAWNVGFEKARAKGEGGTYPPPPHPPFAQQQIAAEGLARISKARADTQAELTRVSAAGQAAEAELQAALAKRGTSEVDAAKAAEEVKAAERELAIATQRLALARAEQSGLRTMATTTQITPVAASPQAPFRDPRLPNATPKTPPAGFVGPLLDPNAVAAATAGAAGVAAAVTNVGTAATTAGGTATRAFAAIGAGASRMISSVGGSIAGLMVSMVQFHLASLALTAVIGTFTYFYEKYKDDQLIAAKNEEDVKSLNQRLSETRNIMAEIKRLGPIRAVEQGMTTEQSVMGRGALVAYRDHLVALIALRKRLDEREKASRLNAAMSLNATHQRFAVELEALARDAKVNPEDFISVPTVDVLEKKLVRVREELAATTKIVQEMSVAERELNEMYDWSSKATQERASAEKKAADTMATALKVWQDNVKKGVYATPEEARKALAEVQKNMPKIEYVRKKPILYGETAKIIQEYEQEQAAADERVTQFHFENLREQIQDKENWLADQRSLNQLSIQEEIAGRQRIIEFIKASSPAILAMAGENAEARRKMEKDLTDEIQRQQKAITRSQKEQTQKQQQDVRQAAEERARLRKEELDLVTQQIELIMSNSNGILGHEEELNQLLDDQLAKRLALIDAERRAALLKAGSQAERDVINQRADISREEAQRSREAGAQRMREKQLEEIGAIKKAENELREAEIDRLDDSISALQDQGGSYEEILALLRQKLALQLEILAVETEAEVERLRAEGRYREAELKARLGELRRQAAIRASNKEVQGLTKSIQESTNAAAEAVSTAERIGGIMSPLKSVEEAFGAPGTFRNPDFNISTKNYRDKTPTSPTTTATATTTTPTAPTSGTTPSTTTTPGVPPVLPTGTVTVRADEPLPVRIVEGGVAKSGTSAPSSAPASAGSPATPTAASTPTGADTRPPMTDAEKYETPQQAKDRAAKWRQENPQKAKMQDDINSGAGVGDPLPPSWTEEQRKAYRREEMAKKYGLETPEMRRRREAEAKWTPPGGALIQNLGKIAETGSRYSSSPPVPTGPGAPTDTPAAKEEKPNANLVWDPVTKTWKTGKYKPGAEPPAKAGEAQKKDEQAQGQTPNLQIKDISVKVQVNMDIGGNIKVVNGPVQQSTAQALVNDLKLADHITGSFSGGLGKA